MVDRSILEELRRAPAHGYAISTALAPETRRCGSGGSKSAA
jgi:hypothetical protein